jgi:gluconate 2-dehydrogenase gamma chain
MDRSAPNLDRRSLLAWAGTAVGGALLASHLGVDLLRAARAEPTPRTGPPRHLAPAAWLLLAAAQARLLPSDDLGPGAVEVNAIGYLDAVLGEPGLSRDLRDRLHAGAAGLEALARRHHRGDFASLDAVRQDALLETFAGATEGRAWIQDVLGFTLEAFLGDPARGANPGGIGWAFLGHEPAEPRPPGPGWRPEERS